MVLDKITGFFKGKRKLRVTLYDEVGLNFTRTVSYTNNTFTLKLDGKEQAYIVDHAFITYNAKNKMPCASYYTNNPNPIRIMHERNDEVDSIGFKRILDDKTIADLFSPEGKNMLMILTMMVGACIVLLIIILAVQSGWISLSTVKAAAGK